MKKLMTEVMSTLDIYTNLSESDKKYKQKTRKKLRTIISANMKRIKERR